MLNTGTGSRAPWLTRRVDRALSIIGDWLTATDRHAYGSISGGKDSLVMAHLIRQVWPDCPFVWVNQGPLAEWPDCIELLHHLQGQGWNIIELCPPRSLLKLYQDHGIPLDGTMATGLDKRINAALMYGPLDDYQEAHGVRGYAWGLRKESRGRAMYLKGKGELYQRKDGLWVCSPVGFWSTQDIWCYIDAHLLSYPAMYDRNRLTVRNGPPIGTTGVNWGRLSDLRRYHPEFWAEFCKHFPEVADHG